MQLGAGLDVTLGLALCKSGYSSTTWYGNGAQLLWFIIQFDGVIHHRWIKCGWELVSSAAWEDVNNFGKGMDFAFQGCIECTKVGDSSDLAIFLGDDKGNRDQPERPQGSRTLMETRQSSSVGICFQCWSMAGFHTHPLCMSHASAYASLFFNRRHFPPLDPTIDPAL